MIYQYSIETRKTSLLVLKMDDNEIMNNRRGSSVPLKSSNDVPHPHQFLTNF